jgi:hypothetical protein
MDKAVTAAATGITLVEGFITPAKKKGPRLESSRGWVLLDAVRPPHMFCNAVEEHTLQRDWTPVLAENAIGLIGLGTVEVAGLRC